MGKKSRRRPGKKDGRPKESASPALARLGIGSEYSLIDLIDQTKLIRESQGRNKWTDHNDALLGDTYYGPYDEAYGEDDEGEVAKGVAKLDPKNCEKGSKDALRAALDKVWSNKALSNPHGVGLAMGPKGTWMDWAFEIAELPDNVAAYFAEYEKDKAMHRSTLEKLSRETEGGFRGSLDYILALNCVLQDAFSRTELDPPPPLHLQQALTMKIGEGRPLYDVRMQVWNGYQKLALKVVKTVIEHPLMPKPTGRSYYEMRPLEKNRGEFPPSSRRGQDEREGESLFGGACGFSGAEVEELMAQGVKPWDDDAHAVLAALRGDHDY